MTLDEFIRRLEGVSGGGDQYYAKCPAHDDGRASLSVARRNDGGAIVNCHAGCTPEEITAALGLTIHDLYNTTAEQDFRAPVIARYDYRDADGKLIAQKLRRADKSFIWRQPGGAGGWTYNRKGITVPPYNLPAVLAAERVYIVEGEKDVDAITAQGRAATCGADGAGKGKWRDHYTDWFKGKIVTVIQDNDDIGKAFAEETAAAVSRVAKSVKVLDLCKIWPELPEHGDTSDILAHLGAVAGAAAIAKLPEDTLEYRRDSTSKPDKPRIDVISAPDLQKATLPAVKFLVNGMLPEGTGMLSAASKIGKSWWALDMGLSVAAGATFMNKSTNRHGVLYLALEDSLSRLQDRMNKILDGEPAPPNFFFATKAPTLDEGLLEFLSDFTGQHSDISLVIIDTLQKIRGAPLRGEQSYAQDYREMGIIKAFMDSHNLSVFIIHHNRKMRDEDDPFNMISGTNGIMGAADTILVMTKKKREDQDVTLSTTGRDIPESSKIIRFGRGTTWKWEEIGDTTALEEQRVRMEYQNNPTVKTIKKLLEQSPEKRWDGTASELMEAGKLIAKTYLAPTPQKMGHILKKLEGPLFDYDGIMHVSPDNGTGGKKHHFYYSSMEEEWVEISLEDAPFS